MATDIAFIQTSNVQAGVHEVAKDLVLWALAEAGARQAQRIVHIGVRVGPQPNLIREELELNLQILTRRTIAEGAEVVVQERREPGVAIESLRFG